jgi:hypothetical protein
VVCFIKFLPTETLYEFFSLCATRPTQLVLLLCCVMLLAPSYIWVFTLCTCSRALCICVPPLMWGMKFYISGSQIQSNRMSWRLNLVSRRLKFLGPPMFPLSCGGARPRSNWNGPAHNELLPCSCNFTVHVTETV